ncbi:leucine--tRNA ligase [Spiroplasma alleghenense]|uniref:Leucine--tRNA ligase n=1 Tax=Spiroplasma alleghenense TaxID=216931 RepID=A0A345Z372_9MOLU|nr:leucine--tRNA ligase [Spiroplasma alleghenense]AXK51051.1 leucyl-tRNA synthetase [Spiroplasma alleghenense]
MDFSHKAVEKKWQKFWEQNQTFKTTNNNDKKAYILDMFPYPSGAGLHVGHPRGYTATDIISRMRRMQGYDVLHPIGWDAFGLPAEQYALKTGNDPREFTSQNIKVFKKQLQTLGFSFDYNKEINTSDPNYYKITQWIFQKMYENGLAETREADVNWCEELGTVLANEEVLNQNGKMVSEVGGFPVIKKPMKQWVLKITKYADRLLEGLDKLDWPSSVKELQKNWIGKSEGLEIKFQVKSSSDHINVFTTRGDTIFGVSYLVLAPEHNQVLKITTDQQKKAVEQYIQETRTKTDIDRQDDSKPKTGVFTGAFGINPVNQELLPIYIADYVLKDYGSGAVMAVPAHDPRDWEFAQKYQLPIKFVQQSKTNDKPFVGESPLINSDFLNKLNPKKALEVIAKHLKDKKIAESKINFKLRDWLFSRQRFYGEPFPLLFLEDGSIALVPESELPVQLPKIDYIKPSGTGESPLVNAKEWVNTTFNGKQARRETNTMPQWAGSCWYYLAYILTTSPNNFVEINSKEAFELFRKWLPVDLYIGGQEHAVLHLLYARFWHQVLFDLKIVPTAEPFQKLLNQGMILGENGEKMSKSKGNVINPDEIVDSHGADTLRVYEMFMGPIDAALPWSFKGLDGSRKWLDRVYRLIAKKTINAKNNKNLDFIYNETVAKVSQMIEDMKYNTAISQMMVFVNAANKEDEIYKPYAEGFVQLLSPFAPHLAEELWELLGHKESISSSKWPQSDATKMQKNTSIIAIQINGKLRATIEVELGTSEQELLKKAKSEENIVSHLKDKQILKEIVVVDKIVNLVIK